MQAGEPWEPFVARCVAEGLAGVESLSGIPGSIGATPIQNVGAYGQEVAETVVSVRVLDRERDVVEELPAADCGFAYRSSAFKRNPGRWVVLAVTFALERRELSGPLTYAELARTLGVAPGEGAPLADVREAVLGAAPRQGHGARPGRPRLGLRRLVLHQPDPRGGRVRGARGARAERAAALPGARRARQDLGRVADRARRLPRAATANPSGIAISSKHTLALTNRGAGTTAELLALAREIAGGVRERFGVTLEPEPTLVGVALAVASTMPA